MLVDAFGNYLELVDSSITTSSSFYTMRVGGPYPPGITQVATYRPQLDARPKQKTYHSRWKCIYCSRSNKEERDDCYSCGAPHP